jgi:hypothetical protein
MDCLSRICVRGKLFTNTLSSNGFTCNDIITRKISILWLYILYRLMMSPWEQKHVSYFYRKLYDLRWQKCGSDLFDCSVDGYIKANVLIATQDAFPKDYLCYWSKDHINTRIQSINYRIVTLMYIVIKYVRKNLTSKWWHSKRINLCTKHYRLYEKSFCNLFYNTHDIL